jgi:hypothetical protein
MKTFKFSLALILAALLLPGCSKGGLTPGGDSPQGENPVEQTELPGAPQAKNACRITAVSPDAPFSVLSLSEGGIYWIALRNAPLLGGTYSFSDDVYTLDGFGTVRFIGADGTKAGDSTERPDAIAVTETGGDSYVVDCTVYQNKNHCVLFRSWNVKKTYISVGENVNIELNGLNLKTLASRLSPYGISLGNIPSGSELKNIDISGTGDFTLEFKDKDLSVKMEWSDMNENQFLLDWENKDSKLDLVKRDASAPPVEIGYGFDATEESTGLAFSLKTKDGSGKEVLVSCLIMFEPKGD